MMRIRHAAALATGLSALAIPVAHADTGDEMLLGTSQAVVLGPTFIPTPPAGYVDTVDKLYLENLGFPDTGTLTTLTTPETLDFGPSVAQGTTDLVNYVEAGVQDGTISPSDPLDVITYSQSSSVASAAMPILMADKVPTADLNFVLLGDPSAPTGLADSWLGADIDSLLSGFGWSSLTGLTTPTDDYPVDEFTVPNDFFSDTQADLHPFSLGALAEGVFLHGDYLGVSDATVLASLTDPVTTGMETTYTLPGLDLADLLPTLIQTVTNILGL